MDGLSVTPSRNREDYGLPSDPASIALEVVLSCWAAVLGKANIEGSDNFFLIGGNSLLLLQVRERLETEHGVSFPIRAFFQHDTAAALATEIAKSYPGIGARYIISGYDCHEPFPLTDLQHAYWIGRNAGVALGGLSAHGYVEVDYDRLDLAKLEAAINRVIARHGMLRAVVQSDGQQRVLENVPWFNLQILDLRGEPDETAALALSKVRSDLSHQVLDVAVWPSFDIRASLLPDDSVRLHISHDIIFCDAWSFRLIWSEIARLYLEPHIALPHLSMTFRDYVSSEIAAHNTPSHRRAEAFWLQRVEQLPPSPPLPLLSDPARSQGHTFTRFRGVLSKQEWSLFRDVCTRNSVTPSVALLTAFADILAVFSGEPRMTLALTVFNRPDLHPDIDRIVGDFTTVALVDINAAGRSFQERAAKVRDELWEALDHRQTSGVKVLRMLAKSKGRDAATLPIVFTSAIGQQAATPGSAIRGQQVYSISQTPQIYFDHQVFEFDNEMHFNWDVIEEFFPEGFIAKMFETYRSWLRDLMDQTVWCGFQRAFTPEVDKSLIARSNNTRSEVRYRRLEEYFLESAQAQPDATALVCQDRTLSYGQLKSLSDSVARDLIYAGVSKGQVVGVLAQTGWEQIAAVLGVLRVGASYLPLDPGHPPDRVRYIAEQAGAVLVLVQSSNELAVEDRLNGLPSLRIRQSVADDIECFGPLPLAATDMAYVIFTSGSTGNPKGVMVTHQSAVNTILDINARFGIDKRDRIFGVSSLTFDLSVYDIFGTFAAGAALILPPGNDPTKWASFASKHGITVWNSVPALFSATYSNPDLGVAARDHLRLVMLSGDWIPLALARQICKFDNLTLVSLGGATEGSIWSISRVIDAVGSSWTSVPYGTPLANQSFAILDTFLEPCPVWVTGELYIGGIGVAEGYKGDARRTAEAFVPDPASGERLYRTGDYGRWLPSGEIEFQGRRDHQVKINGFRIELGEIENAVVNYADMAEAAAIVHVARSGVRQVVVFFVSFSTTLVDVHALRAHVARILPSYMMPASFLQLEKLPLSSNGKIDRKALSAMPVHVEAFAQPAEPLTSTQETLRKIWSAVLNIEVSDIRKGFFDLGGDSLLIVAVQREITKSFGVSLGIVDMFRHPTIEKLSTVVEERRSSEGGEGREIQRKERGLRQPDLAEIRRKRRESRVRS